MIYSRYCTLFLFQDMGGLRHLLQVPQPTEPEGSEEKAPQTWGHWLLARQYSIWKPIWATVFKKTCAVHCRLKSRRLLQSQTRRPPRLQGSDIRHHDSFHLLPALAMFLRHRRWVLGPCIYCSSFWRFDWVAPSIAGGGAREAGKGSRARAADPRGSRAVIFLPKSNPGWSHLLIFVGQHRWCLEMTGWSCYMLLLYCISCCNDILQILYPFSFSRHGRVAPSTAGSTADRAWRVRGEGPANLRALIVSQAIQHLEAYMSYCI